MIDHIGIAISDYEKSKAFYTNVLATLNIELIMEVKGAFVLDPDGHNVEAVCHSAAA